MASGISSTGSGFEDSEFRVRLEDLGFRVRPFRS